MVNAEAVDGAEFSREHLLPHHLAMLREGSSIPDEIIAERGYRSVRTPTELLKLGFANSQCRAPALLIPLHGAGGREAGYVARPDDPRISGERVVKYETPRGQTARLDVPPRCHADLGSPEKALYITEGAKKADALAARGACAINIGGVWNWRGTNEFKGKTALPDWDAVALNERLVRIVFDSDVTEKKPVQLALARLKGFLELKGALVEIVYLPQAADGRKQGIDDFLATGGTLDGLDSFCRTELVDDEPDAEGVRTQIVVTGRGLADISADCWGVIEHWNERKPFLFQRGNRIVRVDAEDDGRPLIREWTVDDAAFFLERVAEFVRVDERGDQYTLRPGRLPADVARDLLITWNKPLPLLRGITGTPVFAPSGALSTKVGYQPETRLYYDPSADPVPAVPEQPTDADVRRGKSLLLDELLGDFPFADVASPAHALAALITVVARELIEGPTPLFVIDAPTPGSGKGLLAEGVCLVAQGSPADVMAEPRDEEETRKRITALLGEGRGVVLFDNLSRPLGSAVLAAALTSSTWSDRILGSSQTGRYPNRALWLATGNNVQISSELTRRTIWIRLDPRVDRPWERTGFRHDPLTAWARENRPQLLWSLLVLVRHWLAAGRPTYTGRPLGSFEAWCGVVGGVLQAAGIEGFLENRDELFRRADREGEEWRAFTVAWWEQHGATPVRLAELLQLAQRHDLLPSVFAAARDNASERALSTRLGRALAGRRDRVFDTLAIRGAGSDGHTKAQRYTVEQVTDALRVQTARSAGSAEVPQPEGAFSDSDAELAEHAEPLSYLRAEPPSTPPHERTQADGGGEGAHVPQVPHVPQASLESAPGGAEPGPIADPDVPHEVPLNRCDNGCGRPVPFPSVLCDTCVAKVTAGEEAQADW